MDKYYLMGSDAIVAYINGGASKLAECKDNFSIIKYNERNSLLKDLLDAFIGWDDYHEISYKEMQDIHRAKNAIQWADFINMINPDNDLNDTDLLEYMATYYKVPEFLSTEDL
jgi:hypothetical protein